MSKKTGQVDLVHFNLSSIALQLHFTIFSYLTAVAAAIMVLLVLSPPGEAAPVTQPLATFAPPVILPPASPAPAARAPPAGTRSAHSYPVVVDRQLKKHTSPVVTFVIALCIPLIVIVVVFVFYYVYIVRPAARLAMTTV